MKIAPKIDVGLKQLLLQGVDMYQLQQMQCLPGPLLAEFIKDYCLENKAIRLVDKGSKISKFDDSLVTKEKSLYEHLAFQIEVLFPNEQKQEALYIAASLDKNGFYSGEITPIVNKIWQLDPIGVATASPKEALLVQLEEMGKVDSLAYQILKTNYRQFLLRDYAKMSKEFIVSKEKILDEIDLIKTLQPFPGRGFDFHTPNYIVPEMHLNFDKKWSLTFENDFYPDLQLIKASKGKALDDAKKFIFQMNQRKDRLKLIVSEIVKKQGGYLLEIEEFAPLFRKDLLDKIDISESTLSRILSEKYIQTPIGIFALSHFFSRVAHKIAEDGSVEKAKQILKELIAKENKKKPYADELLRKLLLAKGVICSRRSIAKYRNALSIPGAYHRVFK